MSRARSRPSSAGSVLRERAGLGVADASRSRPRRRGTSSSATALVTTARGSRRAIASRIDVRRRLEGDHRAVARERQHDGHGRALDLGPGADDALRARAAARSVRPATSRPSGATTAAVERRGARCRPRCRRRRPGVSCSSRAQRSRPGSGSSFSPSKVRSRKTIPVHTTSTLMRTCPRQLALPAGVGVEDPPRGVHGRHERVQRERLHGQLARAGARGLDRRALDGLDRLDQRARMVGHVADRERDDAGGADDARHLDDGALVEERQAAAVRGVRGSARGAR